MAALFSNMDEAQKIRHQRDVLNQGIEDFLDGNYDNPRRVRPGHAATVFGTIKNALNAMQNISHVF